MVPNDYHVVLGASVIVLSYISTLTVGSKTPALTPDDDNSTANYTLNKMNDENFQLLLKLYKMNPLKDLNFYKTYSKDTMPLVVGDQTKQKEETNKKKDKDLINTTMYAIDNFNQTEKNIVSKPDFFDTNFDIGKDDIYGDPHKDIFNNNMNDKNEEDINYSIFSRIFKSDEVNDIAPTMIESTNDASRLPSADSTTDLVIQNVNLNEKSLINKTLDNYPDTLDADNDYDIFIIR